MELSIRELLDQLKEIIVRDESISDLHASIKGVTSNSQRVVPQGLFVAISGTQKNGNAYIESAIRAGAIAIISEDSISQHKNLPEAITWIKVTDSRIALARAACAFYGNPSSKLKLVGLTGTNGKTTITYLIESICRARKEECAVMGTIQYRVGDFKVEAELTTPEAPEVNDWLNRAVERNVPYAVMEASSIALELHRADFLQFEVAAFTNLSQDHLDLHGTMDNYFDAKRKLFDGRTRTNPRFSVINMDDHYGSKLKELENTEIITFSLNDEADICLKDRDKVSFGLRGIQFEVKTPLGVIEICSPLVGKPHAYNILTAVGIAITLGFSSAEIAEGIKRCVGAPGRFERVDNDNDDVTVIVDYAHTPDALFNVLSTVKEAQMPGKASKITTVMGCGGDRDRTKRPLMGKIGAQLSDKVIITSDNPRSENPEAIIEDIKAGVMNSPCTYETIVDRREAISNAIKDARPGEIVVIAGKGHETYQILKEGKIHFDDREVAREALQMRISNV